MDPKIQTIGAVRFRGGLKGGANGEETGQAQCRVEGQSGPRSLERGEDGQ